MKICPICEKEIRHHVVINGKVVNTQRRKYCYDCSPFGSGNNKKIKCKVIADELDSARKRKHKRQYHKYQKQLRAKRKQKLVDMLGGECVKCGYDKCLRALEFHHKDK